MESDSEQHLGAAHMFIFQDADHKMRKLYRVELEILVLLIPFICGFSLTLQSFLASLH